MNMLEERRKRGEDPDVKDCPECLSEIPYAGPSLRSLHN